MGARTRAIAYLLTGGVAMLGGLLLTVLALGTTTGLSFTVPQMGWTLFGNPYLDLWFLEHHEISGLFIATGLCGIGLGLHLVRLGLQHRPQAIEVLPCPKEWRPHGRVLLGAGNVLIGIFLLAGGIASGMRYSPGGSFLTGLGLVVGLLGGVLPYLQSLRRVRRPVVRCTSIDGETGIVVGRSPRLHCVVGMFALALALPGIAGLTQGLHDVREFHGYLAEDAVMSLVFGGGLLLLAVVTACFALSRLLHRDRLALTPTRFIHRTRRSTVTVRWSDVQVPFPTELKGNAQLNVAVPTNCPVTGTANKRINRHLGDVDSHFAEIGFGLFAIDPITLFHALFWYSFFPETRPELATHTGVQRLRNADFRSSLTEAMGQRQAMTSNNAEHAETNADASS